MYSNSHDPSPLTLSLMFRPICRPAACRVQRVLSSASAGFKCRHFRTSSPLNTKPDRLSQYSPWSDHFNGSLGVKVVLQATVYAIVLYGTVEYFRETLNAKVFPLRNLHPCGTLKLTPIVPVNFGFCSNKPVRFCTRTGSCYQGVARHLHGHKGCYNGSKCTDNIRFFREFSSSVLSSCCRCKYRYYFVQNRCLKNYRFGPKLRRT